MDAGLAAVREALAKNNKKDLYFADKSVLDMFNAIDTTVLEQKIDATRTAVVDEIQRLREEIVTLKSQTPDAKLKAKNKKLQDELKELLQKQIDDAKTKSPSDSEKNDRIMALEKAIGEKDAARKKAIDEKNAEIEMLREKLASSPDDRIEKLTKDLAAKDAAMASLENKIDERKRSFETQALELQNNKSALGKANDDVEKLTEQLVAARASSASTAEIRAALIVAEDNVKKCETNLAATQAEIADLRNTAAKNLQDANAAKQAAENAANAIKEAMRVEKEGLDRTITNLKEELASAQQNQSLSPQAREKQVASLQKEVDNERAASATTTAALEKAGAAAENTVNRTTQVANESATEVATLSTLMKDAQQLDKSTVLENTSMDDIEEETKARNEMKVLPNIAARFGPYRSYVESRVARTLALLDKPSSDIIALRTRVENSINILYTVTQEFDPERKYTKTGYSKDRLLRAVEFPAILLNKVSTTFLLDGNAVINLNIATSLLKFFAKFSTGAAAKNILQEWFDDTIDDDYRLKTSPKYILRNVTEKASVLNGYLATLGEQVTENVKNILEKNQDQRKVAEAIKKLFTTKFVLPTRPAAKDGRGDMYGKQSVVISTLSDVFPKKFRESVKIEPLTESILSMGPFSRTVTVSAAEKAAQKAAQENNIDDFEKAVESVDAESALTESQKSALKTKVVDVGLTTALALLGKSNKEDVRRGAKQFLVEANAKTATIMAYAERWTKIRLASALTTKFSTDAVPQSSAFASELEMLDNFFDTTPPGVKLHMFIKDAGASASDRFSSMVFTPDGASQVYPAAGTHAPATIDDKTVTFEGTGEKYEVVSRAEAPETNGDIIVSVIRPATEKPTENQLSSIVDAVRSAASDDAAYAEIVKARGALATATATEWKSGVARLTKALEESGYATEDAGSFMALNALMMAEP